jgi:hypothetical protein
MHINPADPQNNLLKAKIKEWIEKALGQSVELKQVIEAGCADERCPCVQTSIYFNDTKIVIGKPLVYVRKWDIDTAFSMQKAQV